MHVDLAVAVVSPPADTLNGQGWKQLGELGLALLLSAVIGFEREIPAEGRRAAHPHPGRGRGRPCSC